mgnify:CR=1 FL=1
MRLVVSSSRPLRVPGKVSLRGRDPAPNHGLAAAADSTQDTLDSRIGNETACTCTPIRGTDCAQGDGYARLNESISRHKPPRQRLPAQPGFE